MSDGAVNLDLAYWVIALVAPPMSGLLGVITGSFLTSRHQRAARRHEFILRQVKEFYSPLVGIRHGIRSKSEVRLKISNIAEDEWRKLCERHQLSSTKPDFEPFKKIIEYDNKQLEQELLPDYRMMLEIFTGKFWLAEDSTRSHYGKLVEYIEVWNRFMERTLPPEVSFSLEHREEWLHPFYTDLEEQLASLRSKLARGKV